jgi:predicted ArsR family transcriptional regulator
MAADRLAAVGDPALRAALLFARSEEQAVTADELAAHQAVHRNVARSRLERLAKAGLLEVAFERRSGRAGPGAGRPAKTYRAAPELSGIEFPARRYETVLGLLAGALPERGRDRRLRQVGVDFAHELARASGIRPAPRLREGLDRLCRALGELGFQATLEHLGGGEAVIATPTCPLRPLIVARPQTAAIDRGMWAGLVEASLAGGSADRVSCEPSNCLKSDAACRIRLSLESVG